MSKRFVSVWFRHLPTDWFSLRQKELKEVPFVLRILSHGRMVISATNAIAEGKGITTGMVLADARAVIPGLEVKDDLPGLADKLLNKLAQWCIRFTPVVAIDLPDGLIFDASGCAHLWGGEVPYLEAIQRKLRERGYDVRTSIADTPGVAWAMARYGREPLIVPAGKNLQALDALPPESLRLEPETADRLHKLGLHRAGQFIGMPRATLRRRFGNDILLRIDQALGMQIETVQPVVPPEPYQERLPCMDPIVTGPGIELALRDLLLLLCGRLKEEQKGLRTAKLKCYRVDGLTQEISIATTRPSHYVDHLFKLFAHNIPTIDPGLGIELFILEAPVVEEHQAKQESIWEGSGGLDDLRLAELLDRVGGRIGGDSIHRFLPQERYWPEQSVREAESLIEEPTTAWRTDKPRPTQLLAHPDPIEVTAPIPDYPPMLFRYKGIIHKIVRADGPERIEQEWWLRQGQHRDYYYVEDEEGKRYWIFRLGHYDDKTFQWFVHGFFA